MGEDIVGRSVNAVLAPPQAQRFAAVAGVDLNRLVLNVTGWNKLVLLDYNRVFLFPRSAIGVEWFGRGAPSWSPRRRCSSLAAAGSGPGDQRRCGR